ncbi:MAG TPA: GTP-binding protein [Noviherbaspirillum sp.]|uniref:ArgK/MeaB family GTPase n=1 Tax=Noviherbaspirillum sp. TaxID=1926288 RepID=UPI002B477F93|nr:GTP-binding protein [Noviherbaspirillum sp.]HJV84973.1 GTP-binding protein [Noviherbaspirillum sp.]
MASSLDRRALARALTEAARASVEDALVNAANDVAPAPRIGITGAPGVGKSSLIGRLARHRLEQHAPLAVIAVDPSSPHSSGSLLGDRIRMEGIVDDPRLYIRSLPSGEAHDGLSENLPEVLAAVDRFGFGEVIVETVGVGQTEYGVRALVDVEVLVLMPGLGDAVQAMKAGILETADVIVINKADLPGADRTMAELRSVFNSRAAKHAAPPLVLVHKDEEGGILKLSETLDTLLSRRREEVTEQERRRRLNRYRIHRLLSRRLAQAITEIPPQQFDDALEETYRAVLARLAPPG